MLDSEYIEQFLKLTVDTIADVWECPCCRGEDPFINQMHKRWTISQIEKNSKTRRKSILTWKGVITRYRNRFILAHRQELAPFVTTKIIDQLIRSFISNKSIALVIYYC